MKKLILGLFLGFMLHKGLNGLYSYSFYTAERECTVNKDLEISCVYEKMGWVQEILPYLLITPSYTFYRWGLRY